MGYTPYSGAFDKKLGEFLAQPVDYTRYYNQGGAATPPPATAASAATAQRSQVDIPEWMNEEILNIPQEQREAFLNEYGARIDQNVNVNSGRNADEINRAAMRGWITEWKNSGGILDPMAKSTASRGYDGGRFGGMGGGQGYGGYGGGGGGASYTGTHIKSKH